MKMRSLLVVPCVAVFACAAFAATFPRAVEASPHIVECRSEGGSLSVSLAGAQTTSWRPAALGGGEAFFMPSKAPWGEEVHGGLPLCWPWVGRRKGLPIHGLVRYMQWRLARRLDSSCVELATESNADTLALWPHKFRLTARISIVDSATMEVVMSETNTGDEPFESAFGIHPYFSVSDSCSVALDGRRLPRPVGETTKFPADGEAHALSDMLNGRTYSINAPYADTWWAWNPGTETTPEMKTLAPDEWRRFWCLEALRRQPKPLAPGETRVSSVRLAVRRLPAKDAKPYMVIDLSGGPDAASYPISSIDAEPQGGWTDEYKTTKLVLRRIEPGTCTMGCKASEAGYQGYEAVPHEVTISEPFYIGVFEVTQKQYELVTGSKPSYFSNSSCCETRPVERVTWNDIRGLSADYNWPSSKEVAPSSFIGRLRAKTGIVTFDLPTEAAWEYACRAGTTGAYNNDADIDALGRHWLNGGQDYSQNCTAEVGTAKVGSYRPNAWGLYDMHGNVWEWTLDWYQPRISFPSSPATDPVGPVTSPFKLRVLRGGGWYSHAGSCRSASRLAQYADDPSGQGKDFGFRLCCPAGLGREEATVTADFTQKTAKFRPALHSSGYAPSFNRVFKAKWDRFIKEMNFEYVRTHDLALVNAGSRAFDVQYMFPLMHLDATKPENYYFTTTDFMVDLQHAIGQKTFYRLGTSIEHTGLDHFAAEIPKDFDKMAEAFAGTVRHFVKGWGDPAGKVRPIEYWEIWNEPDGANNMWSFNGSDDRDLVNNRNAERHDLFVKFFVKALKRIKSEFPDVKVGGPALCSMRDDWFRPILRACKAEGVAPDFISWHCYGNEPDRMFAMTDAADSMCREEGFPNLEFIMNEWHFMSKSAGSGKSAVRSPDGMNDINSACYSLTVLSRLQTSRFDQAYFYGCNFVGSYGFYNYETEEPNKNFYAMKAFGEIKRDCADICASASTDGDVTAFAARSADGKKAVLLVTDYNGSGMRIPVSVKGAEGAKSVSARVLSFEKNLESFPVEVKDGKFTLVKPDVHSAAFLVTFEL